MKAPPEHQFFVGYLPIPPGLRRFLPAVAGVLIMLFLGLGFAISSTSDDPGDGAFRFDLGRQTLTGTLSAVPYPTITLDQDQGRWSAGETLMLSGGGKRGAQDRAGPLDGQRVTVSGVALTRGDLAMIQLRGGANGLSAAAGAGMPVEEEPLGRWRLTGEICDGKCYAGAMRPGTGLAHKACANLCLIGGVPPVFVATGPVEGHRFFLMADAKGGPLDARILDHVGARVVVEGEVIRRGGLPILRIDPDRVSAP